MKNCDYFQVHLTYKMHTAGLSILQLPWVKQRINSSINYITVGPKVMTQILYYTKIISLNHVLYLLVLYLPTCSEFKNTDEVYEARDNIFEAQILMHYKSKS